MDTPEWLRDCEFPPWLRTTFSDEVDLLQAESFGDLTREKMQNLWSRTRPDRWHSLCRSLALFGVTFGGRMSHLGGPISPDDRILRLDATQEVELPEVLDMLLPGSRESLRALGIKNLCDLDGAVESRLGAFVRSESPIGSIFCKDHWVNLGGKDEPVDVPEQVTDDSEAPPADEATVRIRSCLATPLSLRLFSMNLMAPKYLPPDWMAVVRRTFAEKDLQISYERPDDPILDLAISPVTVTLLSLGFESLTSLPLGWKHLLRVYLPNLSLPESWPRGRSSVWFKAYPPGSLPAQRTQVQIGYEPHWCLRVPEGLAPLDLRRLIDLHPVVGTLINRGIATFGQLTSMEAGSLNDEQLGYLVEVGIHPAPKAGLYPRPPGLRACAEICSMLSSDEPPPDPRCAPRNWEIFRRRLATDHTLEQIGLDYSVTRERIRQIVSKVTRGITSILPLRYAAVEIFELASESGTNVHFSTILRRIGPNAEADAVRILLTLLSERYQHLLFEPEIGILGVGTEQRFWTLLEGVVDLFELSGPVTEFERDALLERYCESNGIRDGSVLAEIVAHLEKQGLAARPDGTWALTGGTLQKRYAEAFKQLYPEGLAIHKRASELYRDFSAYFGETIRMKTERSVVAALMNSPDVVLLERGSYIHIDSLEIGSGLLDLAIGDCQAMFASGISRFNLDRVFQERMSTFVAGGIKTTELLHALIRRERPNAVGLGRCPSVFDRKLYDERMPRSKQLEAYFEEVGGPVSLASLVPEFCERRGWKEYSLTQGLANSELILNYDHGVYELYGRQQLDEDALEELARFLETATAKIDGRIELRVFQVERPVLWHQLGRHPMPFLWSNLRYRYPDRFRYLPTSAVAPSSSQHVNRCNDMATFLLAKAREVYVDEIKREFIGKRGWSDLAYYNALQFDERILRCSPKSYIHRQLLEWSPGKSEGLEEALIDLLSQVSEQEGRPYIARTEIVEAHYDKLPELPDGQTWSPELVAALSMEFESVLSLERVFVREGNSYRINSFEDLLAYLVARNYAGACPEPEFMSFLRREGIYSGNYVPMRCLDEGSPLLREESGLITISTAALGRFGSYGGIRGSSMGPLSPLVPGQAT